MWFKNKDSEVEKKLIELYTGLLASVRNLSKNEAEKLARDMLQTAKQKMIESGQDKIATGFGKVILEREKIDPGFMNMDVKRKDSVKDEDIIWFWNMHPLDRCMMEVDDETSRLAIFMHFLKEGADSEEAANRLRKSYPMFGNPNDTKHTKGEDRPLPVELKDRVNKWVIKNKDDLKGTQDKLQQYLTMNAFIRAEIRAGNI